MFELTLSLQSSISRITIACKHIKVMLLANDHVTHRELFEGMSLSGGKVLSGRVIHE